jgi:hypothetical protein
MNEKMPAYAHVKALIDDTTDGDLLAAALENVMLALSDIAGLDADRPTVNRPGKVARRAYQRAVDILEEEEDTPEVTILPNWDKPY